MDTSYVAPKLSFTPTLSSSTSASPARTGILRFHHPFEDSQSIQTPAIVHYTRKGTPVHLTRDNVDKLPIEMIQVAYEHFLDYDPPTYLQAPFSFTKYLGLRNHFEVDRLAGNPKTPCDDGVAHLRSPHITFAALRDPSDLADIIGNTDAFAACRTFRGLSKITPNRFCSFSVPRPPSVLLALADEPTSIVPSSQKRLAKSLIRSEAWLSGILMAVNGQTNIFAPLVGGTDVQARKQFTENLMSLQDFKKIAGVVINLNQLYPLPETLPPKSTISNLLYASLSSLPASLPRFVLCPKSPHEILRLVARNGIDLFMDEWSSAMSNVGVSLDFCFPIISPDDVGKRSELGHNLFSDIYGLDFRGLASSGIQTHLIEKYGSRALGDVPTRAYVHHLLHTHEMTSHVLLAMHNTCVMDLFISGIRASLRDGTFDKDRVDFEQLYVEELHCLEEARVAWGRVHRERGKGRLKGLGQERKEEALSGYTELENLDSKQLQDPKTVVALQMAEGPSSQ